MEHREWIRQKAVELGFGYCGFAKAETLDNLAELYHLYLEQNRTNALPYLERYAPQRLNPNILFPGVRTVIAVLMNYYPHYLIPETDNFIIAKYAYGKDHHVVVKERLHLLTHFITHSFPGSRVRAFFDSGPVLEKVWAQRCGIGWQGKNTVIINPSAGSFIHIGILLTTLELESDMPHKDHCGKCRRCIDACPTQALETPGRIRIDRCIAYHTIESKEPIPRVLMGTFKGRIFGCDICQNVCPFNRFAKPHREPAFDPSDELVGMRKKEWLHLTEERFQMLFRESCIARAGYHRLKRNIMFQAQF
jgi:epoxyqueuosine reductase